MSYREPAESLLGGKYRILDHLGGGGMGEVYRGENILTGRPVALKILRPDTDGNAVLASRFFHEAQAFHKIRHPNIVDVFDAGIAESGPFIVMECLSGESAALAVSRLGRLSIEATVAIGVDLLDALNAVHRAGMIHHDLRPSNVFLHRPTADVPVVIKLLDFGIAKALAGRHSRRSYPPGAIGTVDYMSPEAINGDLGADGRSDLFSLAVVLFELITGKRPFHAPTAASTSYNVVNAPPPTFTEAGVLAHPMLESILAKALSKRAADRYPTAADFARELLHLAPDARARAEALQEVLTNPRSASSGTLPSAQFHAAPRRSSSPPPSMASARPSTSVQRAGQSSRAPMQGSGRAPEATEGRRPSAGALPLEARRHPSAGALPLDGGRSSRPPPPGREIVTSIPAGVPVPDLWHVRGHVLRAADQFVLAAHGAAVRDRILAQLPSRFSDDFRHGSLAGVVLYDLVIYDAYAAAANSIVLGDDPSSWREIGRAGVEGELASLMRTVSQSTDEAALFRRCTTMWSRLADFGAWSIEHLGDGETMVRVADFSVAPITLRQWLIGVVEQTLRNAGYAGTTVAARIGDTSRASELELLVRLRS